MSRDTVDHPDVIPVQDRAVDRLADLAEDAVHGGAGQADPVGQLSQAEPVRLAVQRPQHLADARDDLHAALRFRRPRNLCLRICH